MLYFLVETILTSVYFFLVEAENINVMSSTEQEVRNSPILSRRNHVSRVQLRSRTKLSSRPVSMPPERFLNARNSDLVKHCDTALEEISEVEKPKGRAATHYRNTYIDTHTLRRTWDKQYKHCGSTSRTDNIMTDLSGKTDTSCTELLSTSAQLYSIAVQGDGDEIGNNRVINAFRPPRTLQPPPGTFYKPPGNWEKSVEDKTIGEKALDVKEIEETSVTKQVMKHSNSIEDEERGVDDEETVDEEVFGLEVSVDEDLSHDPKIVESQNRPFYPRLRARCMHNFENREAHFV